MFGVCLIIIIIIIATYRCSYETMATHKTNSKAESQEPIVSEVFHKLDYYTLVAFPTLFT